MATRSKSSSGAYMSQYDTEVEKRLTALESHTHEGGDQSQIQDLKKAIFEHGITSEKVDDIDKKLAWILDVINREVHRDYYEETKE
jgi:uncharacterized coiled-coil protein SlyX